MAFPIRGLWQWQTLRVHNLHFANARNSASLLLHHQTPTDLQVDVGPKIPVHGDGQGIEQGTFFAESKSSVNVVEQGGKDTVDLFRGNFSRVPEGIGDIPTQKRQ